MAIQEDLIYFLKNGKLKNINFGITRKELFEILGEPESIQSGKTKWNSPLFLYDNNFEFYFDEVREARLKFIQINLFDKYANNAINFRDYGWTRNLTLNEARNFLDECKIKFEEKPYRLDDEIRILIIESGLKIVFSNWREDKIFRLLKFGRSIEFSSPANFPTKQIGLEIEQKYYEVLRKIAEETNISISRQCRKIIENHLRNKIKE